MKVLILAAGYGTRLRSIGEDTPKALLNIGGRSLVDYILDHVEELAGLDEIILVTNDKFVSDFEDWAKGHNGFRHKITIVNDGTKSPDDRLGSIGDIDFVLKKLKIQDDLLVIGGDNLFDYNIGEYIEFASSKEGCVSIGVYDIQDTEEARNFGVVQLGPGGKITAFDEKPDDPKSSLIAMCFYFFPRNTLMLVHEYLKESGKSDRAGDYIRWLLDRSEVYGFKFSGKWYDIGSPESYKEAQRDFK